MLTLLQPADVVAVRTGGWPARWIRLGSALRGQPNLDNHIVVVDHKDAHGTLWGLEGRPGGVGWVDVSRYFTGPYGAYAVSNVYQPKTDAQRLVVCTTMRAMVGTDYDWRAIVEDGAHEDLHLPDPWAEKWNGTVPGHVVCSSLAAYGYHKAKLDEPSTADLAHMEPSDWTQFCLEKHYSN